MTLKQRKIIGVAVGVIVGIIVYKLLDQLFKAVE